jgi:hypothetical protein
LLRYIALEDWIKQCRIPIAWRWGRSWRRRRNWKDVENALAV